MKGNVSTVFAIAEAWTWKTTMTNIVNVVMFFIIRVCLQADVSVVLYHQPLASRHLQMNAGCVVMAHERDESCVDVDALKDNLRVHDGIVKVYDR